MEGFAVTVNAVKAQLKSGAPPFFVNVRHSQDWDVAVMKARGALRLAEGEVEQHVDEIPRDRPIVVYASCPGDEPSFRTAQLLRQHGLTDVHPLLGGFHAYLCEGLPVEEIGDGSEVRKIMLL